MGQPDYTFEQAAVQKIVAKDVATTWPKALAMIEKFELSNDVQNALILKVDQEGVSVDEAVAGWMAENKDTWSAWMN